MEKTVSAAIDIRAAIEFLLQPIQELEHRTPEEVFDIFKNRVKAAFMQDSQPALAYFYGLVAQAVPAAFKASAKYPQPNYITLKIAEEAGEVVRGAVHFAEGRMEWSEVEGEIVQLLAMLIRFVSEGDQVNGIIPPTVTMSTAKPSTREPTGWIANDEITYLEEQKEAWERSGLNPVPFWTDAAPPAPAPSVPVKAEDLARELWGYFKGDSTGGTTSMRWFDNNKSLGGPAHVIKLCLNALSKNIDDGSCRKCGCAPRNEDGLCATCVDEVPAVFAAKLSTPLPTSWIANDEITLLRKALSELLEMTEDPEGTSADPEESVFAFARMALQKTTKSDADHTP
jgi:hypothetical protein